MIRTICTIQKLGHCWDKIVCHGAADAAIVQLNDIFLAASLDAATFQNTAINAQITKLIDNERNPLAIGIFQQVADHRCLART